MRINSLWAVVVGSVLLVAALSAVLLWKPDPSLPEPIILQCAVALREPIEEIVPVYSQQTGQRIEVRYGESQKVLSDLQLTKQGDLFLPADDSYIRDAEQQNLLSDVLPIASMDAVVALKADSTKRIESWNDLLRDDVTVAIANPEAAAISRLVRERMGGRWEALQKRTIAMGPVTQVANAIKVDANIDAGILFDAVAAGPNYRDHLRVVRLKEFEGLTARVRVGVVRGTNRYDAAKQFAQHLSTGCPDIFARYGFTPTNPTAGPPPKLPPPPKETPEIVLYSGSMLRPAIEKTIEEFEKREGVRVIRVYNGCGILVSQMRVLKKDGGQFPDVYFSCDTSFMNQVEDLFEAPKVVSRNQLVIAVKKGNPHGIQSLKDLGKSGLRVGVGHEQQCALGAITQSVLIRSKTLKALQENIVVRSPSGDLLVNQLRTGSLDAVIAYISNVKPYETDLDAIKVDEVNCEPAQPIAASKTTAHPEVVKRLIRAIESAESRSRFEELGFGWESKP